MGNILNLNGIDKRYDGIHALKSLDLEFKSGEIHSIIGENGAGKSTLAKIICGIINPDKGTMVYSDREIKKIVRLSPKDWESQWSLRNLIYFLTLHFPKILQ